MWGYSWEPLAASDRAVPGIRPGLPQAQRGPKTCTTTENAFQQQNVNTEVCQGCEEAADAGPMAPSPEDRSRRAFWVMRTLVLVLVLDPSPSPSWRSETKSRGPMLSSLHN